MVTIRSASVEPPEVPNDGSGAIRVRCVVSSSNRRRRANAVWADLTAFRGSPKHPLSLDADPAGVDGAQARYGCLASVPLLTDPGTYEVPLLALDRDGATALARAAVRVRYKRPDYGEWGPLSPEHRSVLARVGGSAVVEGNLVEVLADGPQALARRLELIEGARRQVNLQAYIMDGEGQSGEIVAALLRKASQGVEVNVILNSDTQLTTSPLTAFRLRFQGWLAELQQSVTKRLEKGRQARRRDDPSGVAGRDEAEVLAVLGRGASGVNMLLFNADPLRAAVTSAPGEARQPAVWLQKAAPAMVASRKPDGRTDVPEWMTSYQGPGGLPAWPLVDYAIHEKVLVVDGERAIVGGRNLDDRYFTYWIDTDLYLEGPIVGEVQRGFLRNFSDFTPPGGSHPAPSLLVPESTPRGGGVRAQFVQSRPWRGEYRVLEALVTAMQMARKRIFASSQYVVLPDSLLRDALFDAAARGVDVRILTNSFLTCREVAFSAGYLISLAYFRDLLDAGIKLYELKGTEDDGSPQPYYHVKEFLIDGELACLGSFNLSIRSSFIESENLVCVYDREIAAAQEFQFVRRIENESIPITIEYLERQIAQHQGRMDVARYAGLLY